MFAYSGNSTENRKSWTMRSCGQEPTAKLICDVSYIGVTSKSVAVCIWATSSHCISQSLAILSKQTQHTKTLCVHVLFSTTCVRYTYLSSSGRKIQYSRRSAIEEASHSHPVCLKYITYIPKREICTKV